MTLEERVQIFDCFFDLLQSTSGRLAKEQAVTVFESTYPELKEDWVYILETLNGQHPIGWTFVARANPNEMGRSFETIKDMIVYCETLGNKSQLYTGDRERGINMYGDFLAPIVNRTLRLGIGKSLLEKTNITPMLAKKYEGKPLRGDVFVTEKLDGNRCIASFNHMTDEWEFYSRSGKPMKVWFDMTGLNTDYIYDGEVMSLAQTELSHKRSLSIFDEKIAQDIDTEQAQLLFNKTSGLINSKGPKTGLIYNIFDIIIDKPYVIRRVILEEHLPVSNDVRILPVLYCGDDVTVVNNLLDKIIQMGGEGVMLNVASRLYENKRTDALLKYKQVKHIDMRVVNVYGGAGKYEGLIGGLHCYIKTDDGKEIFCDVGSGLSDEQRVRWAENPLDIIGSIVTVGYHELTQSSVEIGSKNYSLRFPRLITVRRDKDTTSEY
jgi:DNA ligase-1